MKIILIVIACVTFAPQVFCQAIPQVSHSTNVLVEAKQKGEARAKADIAKGTIQILYYGKPWSAGKPLVDDQSGIAVKIVEGCCVMPEFVAETEAYNATMRQRAKENKEKKSANQASHGTLEDSRP